MICKKIHRLIFCMALVLLGALSSPVFADQIVDDISVHTVANGDVLAVIKFAYPIQYLRHFPEKDRPLLPSISIYWAACLLMCGRTMNRIGLLPPMSFRTS